MCLLLYLAEKKAAENLVRRGFIFTISDKDLFAFPASFILFLMKSVFTLPLPPWKQIQFMPYPRVLIAKNGIHGNDIVRNIWDIAIINLSIAFHQTRNAVPHTKCEHPLTAIRFRIH